jgi:hypothetical protein
MPDIKRPVFMCGENPGLRLYVPGTEQLTAVVSYWHCTYSPWGLGHALVVWLDAAQLAATRLSDVDVYRNGAIFTDNVSLARTLVETLTQHFPEFHGLPVLDLPYVDAMCDHVFDGTRYRAQGWAAETQIEVMWEDVLDQKYLNWPQFPAGDAAYDLTTTICPCRTGAVLINGVAVPGEVVQAKAADGSPSSTAFLAFAESWVGPVEREGGDQ